MNIRKCIKLFSLKKNYSYEDVIKSYRNLCKIHHPDAGGCSDDFSQITKAKEALLKDIRKNNLDKINEEKEACSLCNGSKITVRFCSSCNGQGNFVKISKDNGIPKRKTQSCIKCHSTGKEFCGCLLCNNNAVLSREDIEKYILGFKY